MSIAKQLLEELDKDEKLSNEFISRIAFKLAQNTDIRLLVLNSLIRDVATKMDIEGLGDAIGKDIQELRNETKAEIESLRNETKNAIQELRNETKAEIESLRNETKNAIQELRNETKAEIESLRNETKNAIQELRNETKAEIESLRNETKNQVQLLKGDMIKYVDSKFDSFDKRMNDLNNRIDEVRYDMRTYFFGFLGGIVATLITIILTKFL